MAWADDNLPGLGRRSLAPRLRSDAPLRTLKLSPNEGYVLSRVDGRTTLWEICLLVPMSRDETLRILRQLRARGVIEVPGSEEPVAPVEAAPVTPQREASGVRQVAAVDQREPTGPGPVQQRELSGPRPVQQREPTGPRPVQQREASGVRQVAAPPQREVSVLRQMAPQRELTPEPARVPVRPQPPPVPVRGAGIAEPARPDVPEPVGLSEEEVRDVALELAQMAEDLERMLGSLGGETAPRASAQQAAPASVAVEPEPVISLGPEPEPVISLGPEPVISLGPEPVISLGPEPVISLGPEPEPVISLGPEPEPGDPSARDLYPPPDPDDVRQEEPASLSVYSAPSSASVAAVLDRREGRGPMSDISVLRRSAGTPSLVDDTRPASLRSTSAHGHSPSSHHPTSSEGSARLAQGSQPSPQPAARQSQPPSAPTPPTWKSQPPSAPSAPPTLRQSPSSSAPSAPSGPRSSSPAHASAPSQPRLGTPQQAGASQPRSGTPQQAGSSQPRSGTPQQAGSSQPRSSPPARHSSSQPDGRPQSRPRARGSDSMAALVSTTSSRSGPLVVPSPSLDERCELTPEQRRRIDEVYNQLNLADAFTLLGVQREVDKKSLQRAYYRLSKEFHPDRYFKKELGSYRPRVAAIFQGLTEARDILIDDERRAAYLAGE